ncbi:MAG: hypothetical protein Q4F00_00040 [bacterium]|nr:hypothetical protein [bacterium]
MKLLLCKKKYIACFFLLVLAVSGVGCSSWLTQKRSPFSGLLPHDTPLIVEGAPDSVVKFLHQLEIPIPELGEGLDIGQINCERLLYAAVPLENNGDYAGCRQTIMQTVNSLEEKWTEQQCYPVPDSIKLPQCPYGGQLTYNSDGQQFTITCRGSEHAALYNSVSGLNVQNSSSQPLIFIAFQSDDPQWQNAAISKKYPHIRILTSDPQRTVEYLEQNENNLEIRYPKETSLYASVINEHLGDFWNSLPLLLPGERTIITKNSQTGIYSLRSALPASESSPSGSSPEKGLPSAERCWKQLPQGEIRLAASSELLRRINLLPWPMHSTEKAQPLVFGIATDSVPHLNKLLPSVNSAFSGLTEAGIVMEFTDKSSAEKGLKNSPWGDLSADSNPYCFGEQKDSTLSITIGEKMPEIGTNVPLLPQGPGPVQLACQLTLSKNAQEKRRYLISGGWHNGQLWMEILPQIETATQNH